MVLKEDSLNDLYFKETGKKPTYRGRATKEFIEWKNKQKTNNIKQITGIIKNTQNEDIEAKIEEEYNKKKEETQSTIKKEEGNNKMENTEINTQLNEIQKKIKYIEKTIESNFIYQNQENLIITERIDEIKNFVSRIKLTNKEESNIQYTGIKCFFCRRTKSEIKQLFNDEYKEITNSYKKVNEYLSILITPIKNWLMTLKDGLENNKFLNFSMQSIINEMENLKNDIPHIEEILEYFGHNFINGQTSNPRHRSVYNNRKTQDFNTQKLNSLVIEIENNIKQIEKNEIPKKVLTMLSGAMRKKENKLSDFIYLSEKSYLNSKFSVGSQLHTQIKEAYPSLIRIRDELDKFRKKQISSVTMEKRTFKLFVYHICPICEHFISGQY